MEQKKVESEPWQCKFCGNWIAPLNYEDGDLELRIAKPIFQEKEESLNKKVESTDVPKESEIQTLIRRCRNHLGEHSIKGVLVREDVNQLTIQAQLIEKELADLRAERETIRKKVQQEETILWNNVIKEIEKKHKAERDKLKEERDELKEEVKDSEQAVEDNFKNHQQKYDRLWVEHNKLKADNERLKSLYEASEVNVKTNIQIAKDLEAKNEKLKS